TKRVLAMLLCLIMALSLLTMVASADADPALVDIDAKCSLTIHKYKYNGTEGEAGNGMADQTVPDGATPLEGVTFELYQVANSSYFMQDNAGTDFSFKFVGHTPQSYYQQQVELGVEPVATGTTGADGLAVISNLDVGIYCVVETKYPAEVTVPCDPFFVYLPMTNPDTNDSWMYDVHVYPKNSTNLGNVVLNKVAATGNAPIQGVTFQLFKRDDAQNDYVPADSPRTTGINGQLIFSNLEPGMYYIKELSTTTDYIVDEKPIYFSVSANKLVTYSDVPLDRDSVSATGSGTATLTLTVSNDKPTIRKAVRSGSNKYGAMPGTDMEYVITVRVPENIADLETFVLTDTMECMKLKGQPTVEGPGYTAGNAPIPSEAWGWAMDNQAVNSGYNDCLVLTFSPEKLASYAGQVIWVYYTGTVQSESTTAGNGIVTNTASLEYTSVIDEDGKETATKTIEAVEKAYNFNISIQKIAENEQGWRGGNMSGVEFELYKADKTTQVKFLPGNNGTYIANELQGQVRKLVTGDSTEGSNLLLRGLPAGTYYLKETKTKDGYNLLSGMVTINLDFTVNENGEYVLKDKVVSSNTVSEEIINKKGFTLPRTGGIGALMFILIGGVLVGGGVALMNGTDKKRAR
ncbi:MAG: SpaH/EbpB family LPXTG-anchored major pilin, partial [Faecousia sp.]